MNEGRKFDDFIRDEFKNYSPEVAPHIWEKIAAEKEERKPVGFWFTALSGTGLFWMIGLLLAGSAGTMFEMSHRSSSETNVVSSKTDKSGDVNNTNSVSATTNNTITINKDENSNQSFSSDKESKNLDVTKSKPSLSSINKPDETTIVKASAQSSVNQTTPKVRLSNNTFNTTGIVKRKNTKHTIANNVEDAVASSTSLNNNEPSGNGEETGTSNEFVSSLNQKNTTNSPKNYLQGRLFFEKADMLLLDQQSASSSLKKIMNLPECPTIEKDAAANKRYIEIYIAPDYALRSLTDTANSVYLQKRKESTVFSSAFSAGIRYTQVFSNGMSLRAGINYSQINETFSYIQGNVVQTTYNIDPVTGDTTGSYTVRGSRYKTTYNHYRSFDIPLTIGYEFGNGRFHANINAGIVANIYSWQKGDELDTNYQPVDITTGGKGASLYQFKTNVGLGATGGISFYYKLTDQLHILAEPYARYNFQPMSNDNLTLRQKYTTIGLRVGLRLDIPKAGSIIKR